MAALAIRLIPMVQVENQRASNLEQLEAPSMLLFWVGRQVWSPEPQDCLRWLVTLLPCFHFWRN